ncbi:MAG TPA: AI-2E family transporter [Burkholderiales bacterium]|jgi:predicted PurR-regulated permease PerM|nr:AI-2E family transporter [Burkholderiales bacterium]
MKAPDWVNLGALHHWAFVVLVVAVSLAFGWILAPFFEAILWAIILAVLFAPLQRWLSARLGGRHNVAGLLSLLVILLMVILPVALIARAFLGELRTAYAMFQAGELEISAYLERMQGILPGWISNQLVEMGLADMAGIRQTIAGALAKAGQYIAARALVIGENTFAFILNSFIMLYLLFYLLRDGGRLALRMRDAIPLDVGLQMMLAGKFAEVIRATVKGSVVVAMIQGALGGLIFWILGIHAAVLWGVVMAFLSLVPAVGAGLIWAPAALYLLATGEIWQGVVLIAFGVLVIGLVDNFLRPILVGKSTRMPDYLVLISTLGGIAVFGISGFVTGPLIAALFIAVWDVVATSRAAERAGAGQANPRAGGPAGTA